MSEIINKIENAYTEILNVLKKYESESKKWGYGDINDMADKAKKHLFGIELSKKYDINVDHSHIGSEEFVRVNDYMYLGWHGEKYRRTVAWEDDGKQVEDEYMLYIGFSTGAYIFGDDYPQELFQEFWQELKSYEPKYCDTVNRNLYFSMENASKIFNEFNKILQKYHQKNQEQFKERKIKKMKEELEKLESSK